jgi:hypothetical protein
MDMLKILEDTVTEHFRLIISHRQNNVFAALQDAYLTSQSHRLSILQFMTPRPYPLNTSSKQPQYIH